MKIAALGDSITRGFPYDSEFSWVTLLQQNYPAHHFYNLGENGDTLPGMEQRLHKVFTLNPAICIVTGGINDALLNLPLKKSEKALTAIMQALKDRKIEIVTGIPVDCFFDEDLNRQISEIQHLILETAQKFKTAIADFRGMNPEDYGDECHPSLQGYEKMAIQAEKALKSFSGFF